MLIYTEWSRGTGSDVLAEWHIGPALSSVLCAPQPLLVSLKIMMEATSVTVGLAYAPSFLSSLGI